MKRFSIALATILGMASTGIAFAGPPTKDGVLGYYNAATGAFHPLPRAGAISPDAAPATGTITVSFTITLATAGITSATPINCEVDANTIVLGGAGGYIDDIASVPATVTGTTAKCEVKIPYSWTGAKTSDSVSVSYAIDSVSAAGSLTRSLSAPIATFAVPANGTTKSFTVTTTL